MTVRSNFLSRLATVMFCLGGTVAAAQGEEAGLEISLEPRLFDSDLVATQSEQIREAGVKSGLGLALQSEFFKIDVDYDLQCKIKGDAALPESTVSRQFKAALRSSFPNSLLGIDGEVNAGSLVRQVGDTHHNKITLDVSTALSNLARIAFKYEYARDRQLSRQRRDNAVKRYSIALNGSLRGGRLTWTGDYHSAAVFSGDLTLARSSNTLDLSSRYRFSNNIHLDLSGVRKSEKRFDGAIQDTFMETRYGAALAWSSARHYSLALKLNRLDDTLHDRQNTFGSGSLSWFPRPDLELAFDYGQQQAQGTRGWMVHTRYDFEG